MEETTVAEFSLVNDAVEIISQTFTFENPDLTISRTGNNVTLSGEIAKYAGTPDISILGFDPPTDNVFVLRAKVQNAGTDASVKLTGEHVTKTVTKEAFDGADYVDFILDGHTKTYTIEAQASNDELPVTVTVTNDATLET